jgi:hypothetical protein
MSQPTNSWITYCKKKHILPKYNIQHLFLGYLLQFKYQIKSFSQKWTCKLFKNYGRLVYILITVQENSITTKKLYFCTIGKIPTLILRLKR